MRSAFSQHQLYEVYTPLTTRIIIRQIAAAASDSD